MYHNFSIKKAVLLLGILALVMFSVSCGRSDNTENNPDASPEPTEENVNFDYVEQPSPEPEQEVNFVFPEKGVRPYAVMIDNQGEKCLPQGGLSQAQVIYEVIVEGGITRFMPVFWGQKTELIGPVRSARHYFLDYALEHDAIYVHIGWSPMAMADIPKLGVNNINGAYGVFWDITNDKSNWQDTYTSMEKLEEYAKKVNYRTTTDKEMVFKYHNRDQELEGGKKAEKINLSYSGEYKSYYEYDADKKLYLRFRNGKPHIERQTGEQLTTKNIIIQKVRNYDIKGDQYGRQNLDTVGSGEGYYITNGKCIEIKWSKASRTEKTKYLDGDGKEIVLNPGQTWVQIFPVSGKIEIE
ncbi:MAG TPA: DUF3048 domain-containing protein [Hungateiclostridium thermocellum]|jgi:hypothetical protein|uniref:DUF3048 domain-containing protein n=2 Tax=Acetivibrio thermocellus TaxID=1515 RepID=A3DBR7_ACET2|nr:DUF3048 domain-containing protein [Acetivibrio thermocellus]CDG34835.1 hypothetical protein CTHBC1_0159 [Acetivibrio thermocellus BC1]ABN51396.1 hypothetical protein Cthe_0155 [Acetivibrio thermocellus ATCC 27405]ADU75119.1 hypothetical protein Clo1313_2078 [Acetivibrio thermocellus DSM 1313]ALX09094.1 Protein of unknown function DUF3048 [Acetivibrio thermocellus AD2]ANV76846.1 Protein of unknown function DUF3048 [Acetivibrio thermocellus DSM 2360]